MSNYENLLKIVGHSDNNTIQNAKLRLEREYEKRKVTQPVIGRKYHIKWAISIKCVWRLKDIIGDTCYLTTKNGKIVTCKKSELLETNRYLPK